MVVPAFSGAADRPSGEQVLDPVEGDPVDERFVGARYSTPSQVTVPT